MEHLPASIDVDKRLLQNISLHMGVPSQRLAQPDQQDFMSVCLPEPAENIDPLFLRFLRSSLHYSPMAVPLADGFDSSQVNRPLEHMGDHLLSNLGISPPSCVSEFDFGESQAMGRTRTGLHFLDLPSSSTNSSFNLSSSNNRFPLGIPLSCDPLDLNLLTAPSSTTRPFFDIPPHTSLLLPDVSTNGCTPPSHLPPALSFNSDNPFLLESSFSSDPLDLYLLTASSYGTHTLSDIVSPNSLSSLDALASGDPLELHLLMASSSTSRPSFDVSFPNDNNPPIPGSSPTGDPLGLCLLSASPSNGAHSLFDTSPSSSLSPLGIPPSGDPLEPHPPAVSSSSNIGSSPPDIPSSHDLPELRPHDASSTRSNTPTPVGTTLDPDPTNSHGMPSNRTVVLASRVPVDLQDVDKEDPDNIPLFMNECDRRTYECIWSHGGGRTCGYRGRFAQAKRHIARVHFELKKHQCEECEKRFYTKYDLGIHSNSHQNREPFVCTDCNATFKSPSKKFKHRVNAHGHVPRPRRDTNSRQRERKK